MYMNEYAVMNSYMKVNTTFEIDVKLIIKGSRRSDLGNRESLLAIEGLTQLKETTIVLCSTYTLHVLDRHLIINQGLGLISSPSC